MIRAIIIDDENESRNTIRNILNIYCLNIEVVAEADSVQTAYHSIHSIQPDVIFLDIQLGDGTGFDLLEKFSPINFQIIFITAYNHYALQAIKASALDYILKPVNPEQLIAAVNKISSEEKDLLVFTKQINNLLRNKFEFNRLTLPMANGYRFINIQDIVRCEASNNYTYFYLNSKERVLVSKTVKYYEELLSDFDFIRIHQSHLVNVNYVNQYIKGDGGYVIMMDGKKIDVSRRKKEYFLGRLLGK